jgi:hypothetical protein
MPNQSAAPPPIRATVIVLVLKHCDRAAVVLQGQTVRVQQGKTESKEDQTKTQRHHDLTWKTLQCEGKKPRASAAITFTIFVECLQERRMSLDGLLKVP